MNIVEQNWDKELLKRFKDGMISRSEMRDSYRALNLSDKTDPKVYLDISRELRRAAETLSNTQFSDDKQTLKELLTIDPTAHIDCIKSLSPITATQNIVKNFKELIAEPEFAASLVSNPRLRMEEIQLSVLAWSTLDKTSPEFLSAVLKRDTSLYPLLQLPETKENAIKAVRCESNVYEQLPDRLRNDNDVLIEALKSCRDSQSVSSVLSNSDYITQYTNPVVIKQIIGNQPKALPFIDIKYRHNTALTLQAIDNGAQPSELPIETRQNKLFIKDLIDAELYDYDRFENKALRYASAHLRDDPAIAKYAIKTDGYQYKYLSPVLKADPEMITFALEHSPAKAYSHLPLEAQLDFDNALKGVKKDSMTYIHLPEAFTKMPEILTHVVATDLELYESLPEELRNHPVVLQGFKQSPTLENEHLVQGFEATALNLPNPNETPVELNHFSNLVDQTNQMLSDNIQFAPNVGLALSANIFHKTIEQPDTSITDKALAIEALTKKFLETLSSEDAGQSHIIPALYLTHHLNQNLGIDSDIKSYIENDVDQFNQMMSQENTSPIELVKQIIEHSSNQQSHSKTESVEAKAQQTTPTESMSM